MSNPIDPKTGRFIKIPVTIERIKADCLINTKTGCWNWTRSKSGGTRYGKIWSGKTISTHKAMYQLTRGPIPQGLCVLHDCDNPSCCNPEHLKLGTFGDNNREAFAKGRNPVAENHSAAKLTNRQVRIIFSWKPKNRYGVKTRLARRYGVTATAINSIWVGKSWKSVTRIEI